MTTRSYTPRTEDEIRALVQERIKNSSFQPRYTYARWDEMRYLPSDDESFMEEAAFDVAFALLLEGQKPEPLERYRLDWKPGARTDVNERRRWRARWPWAHLGPCMITRLNDDGKEIRLGPDLSKYYFEEEPPHLIAPPEPTRMIVPPEGDTYAFDWHLEQATKAMAEFRKVRRAMKKRARLTDKYVTWVFKDGQWRGHPLANPKDFLGLEGVKIRFTGHPDESPIPTNQYPALRRFPDTGEYGPWKGVEPLPAGGNVLKRVEVRRQDFHTLFDEWRDGKPLTIAEVLSPDFSVLSGGWKRGRFLECGPPIIRANVFDTDPKLAMFLAKRLDGSKHPELDTNWQWRRAGIREALDDPALHSKWITKERKRYINREHYLNGLMVLKRHLVLPPPISWRAPVDVVSHSEQTIKRAGERFNLGSEDTEKAARVIMRQRAKRRQLEAAYTLAGYVAAGTREYSYGVPSNLASALKAVESYYSDYKDRFGVYLALRPFRVALDMELPGAVYVAAHDGRPPDLEYGVEEVDEGEPYDLYNKRATKTYNEQLRKLGYRGWDWGSEKWKTIAEGKPLPKPLETEIRRLAKDARLWTTYTNRRCRKDFGNVWKVRDEGGRRKPAPDTRSEETADWQLYDRAHRPDPAEYDLEAAIAEGDVEVAGTAYGDPELNTEVKDREERRPWKYEFCGMNSLASVPLFESGTDAEDEDDYQPDFATHHCREIERDFPQSKAVEGFRKYGLRFGDREKYEAISKTGALAEQARRRLYPTYRDALLSNKRLPDIEDEDGGATYVRYEDEETGERRTVKASKLDDLIHELDGEGPSRFGLTAREREIFGYWYGTDEMTVEGIRERVHISKSTYQRDIRAVRDKMARAGIQLPAQVERRGRRTS